MNLRFRMSPTLEQTTAKPATVHEDVTNEDPRHRLLLQQNLSRSSRVVQGVDSDKLEHGNSLIYARCSSFVGFGGRRIVLLQPSGFYCGRLLRHILRALVREDIEGNLPIANAETAIRCR